LAIRRIGARELEQRFGPGVLDEAVSSRRAPKIASSVVEELKSRAQACLSEFIVADKRRLIDASLTVCVATTDVHEYGKLLLEQIFRDLGITLVDGGVSVDPDDLVQTAQDEGADLIALSTYNGIALDYVVRLRAEIRNANVTVPVYVGGRLNQIRGEDAGVLPVDVRPELEEAGAIVCESPTDLIRHVLDFTLETDTTG